MNKTKIMKKYFKTEMQMWVFIVSSIIIYFMFGAITYCAYQEIGWTYKLLAGCPFMPTVLVYVNFRDRNKFK